MLCEYCGKELKFMSDRPDRMHCNIKCRMKSLRVQIPCDECGITMDLLKHKLKYSVFHFCSIDCRHKSKKLNEYRGKQIKCSEKYKEARKNSDRVYVKGVHHSPKTEFKKGWQNTETGKKMIKRRAKAISKGITKPEQFLINLTNEKKLPFNFVGDGQFIVDTKTPDFIYTDKGNKIIEVFSDYWHREDIVKYWHQTEEGTKKYYNDRGYNVLVLWEKELKKSNISNILERIQKFLDETLEFKDISSNLHKKFIKLAEDEFDGDTGMFLKVILDDYLLFKKLKDMLFQNKLKIIFEQNEQMKGGEK